MLKPAAFNGLPSASLSGLFSVTPMDFFPPSELDLKKKNQEWGQH